MRTATYVVDRDYTAAFHPEVAPGHVAFALELASTPPPLPKRVLELGCGQGFGLALLAAANPDIRFEGYDFNASHVAHARGLIEATRLENVTVEALSFATLVERGGTRDVDLAVAHGVYAWVEPRVQADVLAILANRLVEGGIASVSYNCLPGWAPLDPIRELAQALATSEPPGDPVDGLLACLSRLEAAGAAYLAVTPVVRSHVAAMAGAEKAYLAHEYCGTAARALPVREVHERFAAAGLDYVGTATIVEALDAFAVLPAMRDLLETTPAGPLRETLRDFGANRSFRRDLFRLGGAQVSMDREEPSYVLLVPTAEALAPIAGPFGPIRGRPELFGALVAALAERPATAADLAGRVSGASARQIAEALALLLHGQRVAAAYGAPPDPAPAARFNAALIGQAARGRFYGHLASPVARAGVRVDPFELLALAAEQAGHALTANAAGPFLREAYVASASHRDARPTDEQLTVDFATFEALARPRLRALLVP